MNVKYILNNSFLAHIVIMLTLAAALANSSLKKMNIELINIKIEKVEENTLKDKGHSIAQCSSFLFICPTQIHDFNDREGKNNRTKDNNQEEIELDLLLRSLVLKVHNNYFPSSSIDTSLYNHFKSSFSNQFFIPPINS